MGTTEYRDERSFLLTLLRFARMHRHGWGAIIPYQRRLAEIRNSYVWG